MNNYTNSKCKATTGNEHSIKIPRLGKLIHELKTPIHGIKGLSEYLYDHWNSIESDDKKMGILKTIIETGDNLSNIVNHMLQNLDNTEQLEFNFTEVDLVSIIKEAIEKCTNLSSMGTKQLNLNFHSSLEVYLIKGDSFWLGQLLINLITNAINHSNSPDILISLRTENIDENERCIVSVKDNGIGIAKEHLAYIFTPFNNVPGKNTNGYNSTGLGLSICREIVEAHNGQISAFNNEDKGATIEFFFIPTHCESQDQI